MFSCGFPVFDREMEQLWQPIKMLLGHTVSMLQHLLHAQN